MRPAPQLTIGSLFSGIGGLELGLEMSGLGHTVWQVEQSEFCRSVLARHWPDAERFDDVRTVGAEGLAIVDLICGGFPCQDISSAGKGAGLSGSRSGLWFEYSRIVAEVEPEWVVVENVASGASRWVDAVRATLEELGYETLPVPLSARDVDAPHLRKRIFIIAHSKRVQLRKQQGRCGGAYREDPALARVFSHQRPTANANANGEPVERIDAEVAELQASPGHCGWSGWPPISPVCRVDDGISNRTQRLNALGNAVVPQCAEVIGWMIRELEGMTA